jgi:hypothetical protein
VLAILAIVPDEKVGSTDLATAEAHGNNAQLIASREKFGLYGWCRRHGGVIYHRVHVSYRVL